MMVSFFKGTTILSNQKEHGPTAIHVGGEQFHAAAVAVVNYFQNSSPFNEAAAKQLLGKLYQYFPKYVDEQPYLTVAERMHRFLAHPRKSELVEAMAYVLRQVVVDELLANPLNLHYRRLFTDFTAQTAIKSLRDPQTKLSADALHVLGHALDLPMTLSYKELEKPLRARQGYMAGDKVALVIQVQEGLYYPVVKRKEDFAYVGQLAVSVKPVEIAQEQEGTLADVFTKIAVDNKRLLHAYEQLRANLLTMMAAGEVTYTQLKEHYIALLPAESHTAAVVRKLSQAEHPVIAGTAIDSVHLLVNTLASMMAAGAIKEDALFERIENTSARAVVAG